MDECPYCKDGQKRPDMKLHLMTCHPDRLGEPPRRLLVQRGIVHIYVKDDAFFEIEVPDGTREKGLVEQNLWDLMQACGEALHLWTGKKPG